MIRRSRGLFLNLRRHIVLGALIVAVCAVSTGCHHKKGYFAPSPVSANHVAAHTR